MPWEHLVFIEPLIKFLKFSKRRGCVFVLRISSPPNCTCEDLKNYIADDLCSDSPQFDSFLVGVDQGWTNYGFLNEFLCQELFEGKVRAWGKKVEGGRISLRESLIPKKYWEFNRFKFGEEEVDPSSGEEVIYTEIRFNQKQVIKQLILHFNKETS